MTPPAEKKLSVLIPLEQWEALSKALEYGQRRQVFPALIEELLFLFEKDGAQRVVGGIMKGEIELRWKA